jgi:hypothetical protein
MRQTADAVLMIRPAAFGYNAEAAQSNAFQQRPAADAAAVAAAAVREFDAFVKALRGEGLAVAVVPDSAHPLKPDAVFPNNWVSFHADGTAVLYPMQPVSRRAERRLDVVAAVRAELGLGAGPIVDLSASETAGHFLEGTGSLVLDHVQRVAYACLSPRTDRVLVQDWCSRFGFEPECFAATDAAGRPWYHTNVMLSIGSQFVVVAAESIDSRDRGRVLARLAASGREIVRIDRAAVAAFCGNVLEVAAWDEALGDARILVLSASARAALDAQAFGRLSGAVDSLLVVPVPTIERIGGGSVRCMMAEVFRPALSAAPD